jgi:riboflavin kinase/FMN adenylyltransferase
LSTEFIHGIDNLPRDFKGPSVVTVGTFDGIHRGHQAIFARVKEVAESEKLSPVLVTFHPHPRTVVSPEDVPMLLTTIEEKKKFLPCFFDGTVLVIEFNQQFRNFSAEEFVRQILVDRLGVRKLIVGYDHHLGKNRSGTARDLERLGKEIGFDVEIVGPVIWNDAPISSTRVRNALMFGKYSFAVELLGHDYAIYGTVEKGIGLGQKIGYPTANVKYSDRKLLPPEGVYACWALIGDQKKHGMMFVGQNHFNPEAKMSVEANLFDFDRDIYGEGIIVYPTHYVRKSTKFASKEDLMAQLGRDKEQVLEIQAKGENLACQ